MREERDKCRNLAYARVIALRLREQLRCNYFSCRARSGVFIGKWCVPIRLLAQRDLTGSRASFFLAACLSKRVARIAGLARVASWGKTHCLALDEAGLGVGGVCGGNGGDEGRQGTQGGRGQKN